jgi:hypothetical protein
MMISRIKGCQMNKDPASLCLFPFNACRLGWLTRQAVAGLKI